MLLSSSTECEVDNNDGACVVLVALVSTPWDGKSDLFMLFSIQVLVVAIGDVLWEQLLMQPKSPRSSSYVLGVKSVCSKI